MILDETVNTSRAGQRHVHFFTRILRKMHPCREGTFWMSRIIDRIESGKGTKRRLTCSSLWQGTWKTSAYAPWESFRPSSVISAIDKFRADFEARLES